MAETKIEFLSLNSYNKPTDALLKLLQLLQIKHDGSLENIVTLTQKAWLRPDGTERWHIHEQFSHQMKEQIAKLLEELGFIDELKPDIKVYDYAILLSTVAYDFRERLAYLASLWQQGCRFKSLIVLSGVRVLDPIEEGKNVLLSQNKTQLSLKKGWQQPAILPSTETEMLRFFLNQVVLPWQNENIMAKYFEAPQQKTINGLLCRPSTSHSIDEWLNSGPVSGTCLVISNQPHVLYQRSVFNTVMPSSFEVEVVGPKSYEPITGVYLDSLTRYLYQERERLKKDKGTGHHA